MQVDGFEEDAQPGGHRVLQPGVTMAVRVAFYAVAALSIASLIAAINEISAFDTLRLGRGGAEAVRAVADAEQLSEGFVTLVLWVGVVTGILTIRWWHRAYRAILSAKPVGLRWSPGWAVGAWFIPIGNLIISKLILDEIDRVSRAAEAGDSDWASQPRLALTGWWWLLWVGGLVVGIYGATMLGGQIDAPTFDADTYRTGLVAIAVAHAVSIGAAFLAAASLRVLGERLHRV